MVEWGIPFDHIEERWTNSQLALMAARLLERKEAEQKAHKAAQQRQQSGGGRSVALGTKAK